MAIPVPMLAACIAFLAVPLHAQGQSGGLAVSDNRVGTAGSAEASLETFSDPVELWGSGIEAVIEGAYRECFRTFILGGRIMTLRMPFAQNNERAELAGADLDILGGGKADPAGLWDAIEALLRLDDFALYAALLSDGREKVLIFDLASRGWSASYDLFDIARMKAGAYRGLPHKPYVLSSGKGMQATDIYNYLFCVGRLGMDCSGFAWHILKAIGLASGVDLERQLARTLRVPRGADQIGRQHV